MFVATGLGEVTLAGYQVVNSVWGLAAFALDALAIAAQALVGHGLGADDVPRVRAVLRRTLQWGVAAGAGLGVVMAAGGWWFALLFTSDPDVRTAVAVGMAVCGALLPMAGWVSCSTASSSAPGTAASSPGRACSRSSSTRRSRSPSGTGRPTAQRASRGCGSPSRGLHGGARLTTGLRARGSAWMVTGAA